jgi:hypothetical protein
MIPWIFLVFVVNSPFSFLIWLIWVFCLLLLVRFARGLPILFIFSRKQLFCFVEYFFYLYFIDYSHYFYYFSRSASFGFCLFLFFRSLKYSIRLFIWDLSVFLTYAFLAINFTLSTAFAVSHRSDRLCFHFY